MINLSGKNALVVGIASKKSIAYGIAQALHQAGASLALTYQGDKLQQRVEDFGEQWDTNLCFPCDVANDQQIENVFSQLKPHWSSLDILIHSVGFAPIEALDGDFVTATNRDHFRIAHDISAYSFIALAKAAQPMLTEGASLLTLTYLGAQRAIPNYNIMGPAKASLEASVRYLAASFGPHNIRVNGISAGPIRTLAASGVKQFRKMQSYAAQTAPLQRSVTIEEVGNTASFLCSPLASGITGQILYVDAGYSIAALPPVE